MSREDQMPTIHGILEAELDRIPDLVLEHLVEKKLRSIGVQPTDEDRRTIINFIHDGGVGAVEINKENTTEHGSITLEFTDEDLAEFDRLVSEQASVVANEACNEISNQIAVGILETLKAGWKEEARRQRREAQAFQSRLLRLWDKPLGLLGIFLTVAKEIGDSVNQKTRNDESAQPSFRVDVITRLHARACQVAHEITVLLAAGFADGAMARWRTLHEITVVALFIGEHDEELAERYILHQAVEERRAAREYQRHMVSRGYEPFDETELRSIEQRRNGLAARFGQQYTLPYGWAAHLLNRDNLNFAGIERAVRVDHLRPHYRLASHNVHAEAKGIFFRLGLLEEHEVLLAGPSNIGLADPGHATAISLLQISTQLLTLDLTLDNLVALRLMCQLEEEVGDAFMEVHSQQLRASGGGRDA